MYEQDYIMRLINEMVRTILKLLFNIDTESPSSELLKNAEEKQTLESLLDMIDEGRINEAENTLYDSIKNFEKSIYKSIFLCYNVISLKERIYYGKRKEKSRRKRLFN